MSRVTLKSSTIFISVGNKTQVYRSVEDVPPRMRKKLEQSTNGINSATILIADRRGRQEIARAIRGLPSSVRRPVVPGKPEAPLAEEAASGTRLAAGAARSLKQLAAFAVRYWAQILVIPAVGTLVWFLSTLK